MEFVILQLICTYKSRNYNYDSKILIYITYWTPLSLSELTPYQISLWLTLFGSEAIKYRYQLKQLEASEPK